MDLCRHRGTDNFYMSSAFYMKLNITINFYNNFVCGHPQNMAVFLHEYIHYLQDVSTTYGYLQIHNSLEHLVGYLYHAQNSSKSLLHRFLLNDTAARKLSCYMNCTLGDNDEYTYATYEKIEIKNISPSFTLGEIKEFSSDEEPESYWKALTVPTLHLIVKKAHVTDEKRFNFGALAISECMASLIQKHVYPKADYGLQIQYDIAQILYEYIMGSSCDDKFIVELCDIALMDNNPGAFYYRSLLCMKKYKFFPQRQGDIFEFTQQHFSPFNKMLLSNYDSALQSIRGLFQNDKDGFGNLQKYTINNLTAGINCRKNDFDFINKIMNLSPSEALKYWRSLTYKFRFPLIINKENECFGGMEPTNEKYNENFYIAFHVLGNILCSGKSTICDLVDVCSNRSDYRADINCKTKADPWNKLANGNMCPLAVLWKMWQLENKSIIYD